MEFDDLDTFTDGDIHLAKLLIQNGNRKIMQPLVFVELQDLLLETDVTFSVMQNVFHGICNSFEAVVL